MLPGILPVYVAKESCEQQATCFLRCQITARQYKWPPTSSLTNAHSGTSLPSAGTFSIVLMATAVPQARPGMKGLGGDTELASAADAAEVASEASTKVTNAIFSQYLGFSQRYLQNLKQPSFWKFAKLAPSQFDSGHAAIYLQTTENSNSAFVGGILFLLL